MRRADAGKGSGKAIFALCVVLALAFVAIKTLPVYVHNFQFQAYLRELAVQATVQHFTVEAIRKAVVFKAKDLDLPIAPENVKATAGNKVTIEIDYSVPIDLKVYNFNLHFTPSAENRAIL